MAPILQIKSLKLGELKSLTKVKPYLEPRSPDNQSGACAKDAAPTRFSASVPSKAPAQSEGPPTDGGEQSDMAEEFSFLLSKGTVGPHFPSSPLSFPRKPSHHPCFVAKAALQTATLSLFLGLLAEP